MILRANHFHLDASLTNVTSSYVLSFYYVLLLMLFLTVVKSKRALLISANISCCTGTSFARDTNNNKEHMIKGEAGAKCVGILYESIQQDSLSFACGCHSNCDFKVYNTTVKALQKAEFKAKGFTSL
jgi:hypothetical protein